MPGLYSDSQEYTMSVEDLSRQRQRIAQTSIFRDKTRRDGSRGNSMMSRLGRTRDQSGVTGRARFGEQISTILQSRLSDSYASASSELSIARGPSAPTVESQSAEDTAALRMQSPGDLDTRYTRNPSSRKASQDSTISSLASVLQRKLDELRKDGML